MEQKSQFLLNCSSLTESNLLSINLASTTSSIVSFLISFIIILLLLIYKCYQSVLQRMLLYLLLATNVNELVRFLSVEHQFRYEKQDEVCEWIGFFYCMTSLIVSLYNLGIMIYLLSYITCLAKGNTIPKWLQSNWRKGTLEFVYVTVAILFSFGYAWMPYVNNNYGISSAWCWIRTMNENCTVVGLVDQMTTGYLFYIATGALGVIMTFVIVLLYYKLPPTFREARMVLKKTFSILIFLFIYITVVMSALVLRMNTANISEYRGYIIWVMIAIMFPLAQLLFPLGFLFSFYSTQKFRSKFFKKASKEWRYCCICSNDCARRKYITSHHNTVKFQPDLTQAPTVPPSTRVSPPSNTFFQLSYTNNFTKITTDNIPLISNIDVETGYGSFTH